jgi:hypothetical protein
MKKAVIALFGIIAMAGSAFAGTTYMSGKETKQYKAPPEEPFTCFADREFQVDIFGTYKVAEAGGEFSDGFGGGVGVNYFFQRYVGLGAEGSWDATGRNDTVIHHVNGMLILRYPIDSICLAPYLIGGGGGTFDGTSLGQGFIGGGLEYRVVPHKFGLFGDGRFTWSGGSSSDYGLFRAGFRVVF